MYIIRNSFDNTKYVLGSVTSNLGTLISGGFAPEVTTDVDSDDMLLLEEDVANVASEFSDSASLFSTSSLIEPESVVTLEGLCETQKIKLEQSQRCF